MKVLVVGAAKTGTTIISKTIQGSLKNAFFHMEPKDPSFFMRDSSVDQEARVVKVIFEHWNSTPNLRKAVIANELPFKFDRIVMIIRDPRDEMLSRVMYFVYPWLSANGYRGNETKVENWLSFIEQVERTPANYSFKKIVSFMNQNFSVSLFGEVKAMNKYRVFCEEMKSKVQLVRYEDFVVGDYSVIESYLEFPLVTKNGLSHQYQRTRRSASFNNWKPLFKQEDKEFFGKYLGEMMEKQGYIDWEFKPTRTLPSDSYSGYLRRVVADYRKQETVFNEKKSSWRFLRK